MLSPIDKGSLPAEGRAYLSRVLAEMTAAEPVEPANAPLDAGALAAAIFAVLTSRKFCDLGRRKAKQYENVVIAALNARIAVDGPLRFFFDVGPGYHATTRPGAVPLSYSVGLSELLLLAQVGAFCREVAGLYPPGARFFLVVDNICALRTNDIPLDRTAAYARDLRALIDALGMVDRVEILVESEVIDLGEYDSELAAMPSEPPADEVAPAVVDNVARFLGRSCDAAEAARRVELYRRTGAVTDRLLNRFVQGVHMTQRATGATLGFRSFPGGDQRTQVGELGLTPTVKGSVRPVLLTTRNIDAYDCERLDVSDILPRPIAHVTVACPRTLAPQGETVLVQV